MNLRACLITSYVLVSSLLKIFGLLKGVSHPNLFAIFLILLSSEDRIKFDISLDFLASFIV